MKNIDDITENVSENTEKAEKEHASEPDEKVSMSEKSSEAAENKKKADNDEEVSVSKEIWGWIKIVVIALVAAYLINNYVIINANIPSASMESTVMTGDRLIGFRLAYKFEEPSRGDIIIFKYPKDESETFIKRIIGLPGETVIVSEDGTVSIKLTTGTVIELDESYINEPMKVDETTEYVVGEDEYFVMGDNRNWSSDSRVWGCVPAENILAKAVFRYWPFNSIGQIE